VPGGDVGELPFEVGQALGESIPLLAECLGCRPNLGHAVLVPVSSVARRLVHASSDSSKSGAGPRILTWRGLPSQSPCTLTRATEGSVKLTHRKSA
jgi:hypothetical protein